MKQAVSDFEAVDFLVPILLLSTGMSGLVFGVGGPVPITLSLLAITIVVAAIGVWGKVSRRG